MLAVSGEFWERGYCLPYWKKKLVCFVWCVWGAEFFFSSFFFFNSFLTPAFLWSQSNLSWKGSLNTIWSKLCSNQVTKARAAHAMLVALGLTKVWSSAAEVLCLSWASDTRVCRRFCSLPWWDGAWLLEASFPPACPLVWLPCTELLVLLLALGRLSVGVSPFERNNYHLLMAAGF